MQPWQVHVVAGTAKARLQAALQAVFNDPQHKPEAEYNYYPSEWFDPFLSRRRKLGWELYSLLGIGRRDTAEMRRQHGRNYDFFDAPAGLFFTMDGRLEYGSWLDCGMFIQSVMIAARGLGLHTCPQAAFTSYHRIIRTELSIPQEQILLCGMALGHEDVSRPENALRSDREPVSAFTTYHED